MDEKPAQEKVTKRKATFLTGTGQEKWDINNDDCEMVDRFRAHADMCNGITYVPELHIIALSIGEGRDLDAAPLKTLLEDY